MKIKEKLRTMVESFITGDVEGARSAFKDVFEQKSKQFFETDCGLDPKNCTGDNEVKGKMKKVADAEIKGSKSVSDDPKSADGDTEVKGKMKKVANAEIKGSKSVSDDPKSADGDTEVKGKMKKTADTEIK